MLERTTPLIPSEDLQTAHKGRSQDPIPRAGEGGLCGPRMVLRRDGFCGRWRRRRFCFRHTAGGNFFVLPYVSILKIRRILWKIQWVKHTKKF